jgi:hypothetical protein
MTQSSNSYATRYRPVKFVGLAFFTILLFSCHNSKDTKTKATLPEKSIHNKLKEYFDSREITPSVIVNNVNANIYPEDETILLSNHKIIWVDKNNQIKLKIDSDEFTLEDKVTLNVVWGEGNDSINFANSWEEIKLFKVNERELIGIKMSFQPCTGLGCGVDYYLIYDVQTKVKSFFGNFRTDDELRLYKLSKDNKVNFLSKSFYGDAHGSTPVDIVYELYSLAEDGKFENAKDLTGQKYFLKHTTFPNDSVPETLEQHWMIKIN